MDGLDLRVRRHDELLVDLDFENSRVIPDPQNDARSFVPQRPKITFDDFEFVHRQITGPRNARKLNTQRRTSGDFFAPGVPRDLVENAIDISMSVFGTKHLAQFHRFVQNHSPG